MGRIVRSVRVEGTPILVGPIPQRVPDAPPPADGFPVAEAVDAVQVQAEAILLQAREEAAQIRRMAYNDGYSAGLAQGRAEAEAQTRVHLQTLRALVAELQALKARVLSDAEPQLVNLALAVAEAVLHHAVEIDPSAVTYILKAAVQQVHAKDILRITVNPRDHELIMRYWAETRDPDFRDHGLEIVADEEISPGGVVVHTTFGRIDGRIEVQLEEIGEAFRRWREQREGLQ